jgi:dimethylhistidine N-methyltransferase
MDQAGNARRPILITADTESFMNSFAEDVAAGLSSSPKRIPCIYFYDYQGSLIFEEICNLPEYYLCRAEDHILRTCSEEIISHVPPDSMLVELGSGSCVKTRYIIEKLLSEYDRLTYSPIDISRRVLRQSSMSLLEMYEDLEVIAVAAEYGEGLKRLGMRTDRPKLILWLGSSIGNFGMAEAAGFIKKLLGSMSTKDRLLIGFDLVKDRRILERAYNDSRGVTARFNLNLLRRINRELGGEFDLGGFTHEAVYNEGRTRIEMYIVSGADQDVRIAGLDRSYHFRRGERIHTENSYKFSRRSMRKLAEGAGLEIIDQWLDDKEYFSLTMFGKKGQEREESRE